MSRITKISDPFNECVKERLELKVGMISRLPFPDASHLGSVDHIQGKESTGRITRTVIDDHQDADYQSSTGDTYMANPDAKTGFPILPSYPT